MSRRVLVTGATGFVGRAVTPELESRGCEVVILDRQRAAGTPAEMVDWIADHQPDVIIHLATHFLAAHSAQDIAPLVRSNVELATIVAEGAVAARAPLVNAGTAWQHFEGRAYDPVSLYAATKQAFSVILEYYSGVQGLDVREVTLFDTYGPGDVRPKLIPALLAAAQADTPLQMSDGGQLIDLTYVDDVARGLCDVALAERSEATSVVRSWRPITVRALVDHVETTVGRELRVQWGARKPRPREMRNDWVFGASPAGWQPRIDLAEGLRRTWVAYVESHS